MKINVSCLQPYSQICLQRSSRWIKKLLRYFVDTVKLIRKRISTQRRSTCITYSGLMGRKLNLTPRQYSTYLLTALMWSHQTRLQCEWRKTCGELLLHGNNEMPQVKAERWCHIWVTHTYLCSLSLLHTQCVCVFLFKRFRNSYHNSGIVTLQLKNAAIWRIEMMQLVDNRWYGYSCYQGLASPRLQYLNTACKIKSQLWYGVYVCVYLCMCGNEYVSFNWSLLKKPQNKPKGPRRENMRSWLKECRSQSDYWYREEAL